MKCVVCLRDIAGGNVCGDCAMGVCDDNSLSLLARALKARTPPDPLPPDPGRAFDTFMGAGGDLSVPEASAADLGDEP